MASLLLFKNLHFDFTIDLGIEVRKCKTLSIFFDGKINYSSGKNRQYHLLNWTYQTLGVIFP